MQHSNRHNPFKNGIPGNDWWHSFLCFHSLLVKRKPQQLQLVRAQCLRVETVNHWFIECLKPTLDALQLHDSPSRIFNVDEVGFSLSGRAKSMFIKKRYEVTSVSHTRFWTRECHGASLLQRQCRTTTTICGLH